MKTYRITFARNEVISCKEIKNVDLDGVCRYEHNNGHLVYAIIKTMNEDNALTIANLIIKEVKENQVGKYIHI